MFSNDMKTYNIEDIKLFHDKVLSRMSVLAVKLKGHTAVDHEEFDILDRLATDLYKLYQIQHRKIR